MRGLSPGTDLQCSTSGPALSALPPCVQVDHVVPRGLFNSHVVFTRDY